MNIDVTPRRTVGITGLDVGGLGRGMGMLGQDDSGITVVSTPVDTSGINAYINAGGGDSSVTTDPLTGLSTYVPSTTNPLGSSSGSSINWNNLLAPLTSAGTSIANAFAASQLKPGQTVIGANGQVLSGGAIPLATTTTSVAPLLMIAAGGLLLVMLMKEK